jgi:hypothetical protein
MNQNYEAIQGMPDEVLTAVVVNSTIVNKRLRGTIASIFRIEEETTVKAVGEQRCRFWHVTSYNLVHGFTAHTP